jgi:hypothetical protein
MQFGERFLASVVAACAVGIVIGVLLVHTFGKVEPASRAFDELPPAEAVEAPPPPAAPDLGVRTIDGVLGANVVTLAGVGPVRLLGIEIVNGPGGKPIDPDRARAEMATAGRGQESEVRGQGRQEKGIASSCRP